MTISVFRRNFDINYWHIAENNLVLPNLCSYESKFFIINPTIISDLSGNKDTIFTPSQIMGDFSFTTQDDIVIEGVENFENSNWENNGWTINNENTFFSELSEFVKNNLGQQDLNLNFIDVVIVISRGNIDGSSYSIPFCFFGNHGDNFFQEGLVFLSHFDNNYVDSGPNNLSPTIIGNTSFEDGVFGQAVFTNGGSGTANAGHGVAYPSGGTGEHFDFGSEDFTIDFRVNFPTGVTQSHFFNRWVWGAGTGNEVGCDWYFFRLSNGGMRFQFDFNNQNRRIDTAENLFPLNTWHHVALVRSGNTFTLYKNGTSLGSMNQTVAVPFTPSTTLNIGRFSDRFSNTTGSTMMDEIRILKGVAAWTSNFTPPDSPY